MKLLKFSATWCGPCKQLTETLKGMDLSIPVEEIDVDTKDDRITKYAIRSVPTLILVDDQGTATVRHSGALSGDAIKAKFNI